MEKVPTCAKCEAIADSSFAAHRLTIVGKELAKCVTLIYCSNCGAVQGIINL